MVQYMRGNGKTILKRVKEKKFGKTVRSMKESTKKDVKMVTEFISGQMEVSLREIGLIML